MNWSLSNHIHVFFFCRVTLDGSTLKLQELKHALTVIVLSSFLIIGYK